jgi:hypothetical protein
VFRVPKYFIFAIGFVGLSILVAFAIYNFQAANHPGRNISSVASDQLANNMRPILKAAGSTLDVREIARPRQGCMCLAPTAGNPALMAFDDENSCSRDRMYMQGVVNQKPAIFREMRATSSNDFPIECLSYILRNMGSETKPSSFFTRCTNSGLDKENLKPCITKNYVTVIYNYFGDMTDCFGLNQRAWIPKIFRESGFHLSAQSGTGAVGIGQLTDVALVEANKEFGKYQKQLMESTGKASCDRLKSAVKNLNPVQKENLKKNDCVKTKALQDPTLNIFYASIVDMQNRKQIETVTTRTKSRIDIYGKMASMGLDPGMYDKERLVEILLVLGYNAGPVSATILLSNYLDYFKGHVKRPLKHTDISIQKSKDQVPTFFDYVRNHQATGNPGWMDDVYDKAVELNKQFKEGTCVPESYFSL